MNLENAKVIALQAFTKLDKTTDTDGNYLHMQISFTKKYRAYIFLCPKLNDHFIIHEEYDDDHGLNNTRVMFKKHVFHYILRLPAIDYVGLREDPTDSDKITKFY